MAVGVGLVDLGALGQLAVGLQTPGLVGAVLEDDVALLVLVVAQRQEDDVALVDPDFFAELALDMGKCGLVGWMDGRGEVGEGVLGSGEGFAGGLSFGGRSGLRGYVLISSRRRSRGPLDGRYPAS